MKIKRYLVFNMADYYPMGGWKDLIAEKFNAS